jgi:DNA-binding PadR family transcriptional regulator
MVLGLLAERPMHPYEMQRIYHWRGKGEVVNVQRGSLYPVVERLVAAGLVEPVETARDGRRPERTVYRLTPEGRETAHDWLLDMLSTPRNEYPEFPAALAFLPLITPGQVQSQLSRRAMELRAKVAALETVGRDMATRFGLPRIFGLEDEYRLAMLTAELAWVDAIIAELSDGSLDWDDERIAAWAAAIEGKAGELPGGP